jgi:hypothetical protein
MADFAEVRNETVSGRELVSKQLSRALTKRSETLRRR